MGDWFWAPPSTLIAIVLSACGIYVAVLVYTQLAGLRSFAKMSSFDFAMTVAIGSMVAAGTLNERPALVQTAVGLAAIYGLQYGLGLMRRKWVRVERLIDNEPLLLMMGNRMLKENMKEARVTEDDLWSKLREANVLQMSQIRAVVLETTGDISVLHGDADGPSLEPKLLTGVRDANRQFETDLTMHPALEEGRGDG